MKQIRPAKAVETSIVLLLIFSLVSCGGLLQKNTLCIPPVECDTILLMYMTASNNLEPCALRDLDEIRTAMRECGESHRVIVLMDRIADASETPEDWDEARLFDIYRSGDTVHTDELESSGLGLSTLYIDDELNMGEADTLRLFLDFAADRYSAAHYYLDIWDHGGSWVPGLSRGIGYDDEAADSLSLAEIREAADGSGIGHFDGVLLDACGMGSLEVAAAFLGLADTIVFSQDVIPFDGFPYDVIVKDIMQTADPVQAARGACDHVYDYYKESDPYQTVSALKVDRDTALLSFIEDIRVMLPGLDIGALRASREYQIEMPGKTVDFRVFEDSIEGIEDRLDNIVIAAFPEEMSGVSVYFPEYFYYDEYSGDYNDEQINLLHHLSFDEFLSQYNHTGIENLDTHEPNNTLESAYPLEVPGTCRSYIWCEADLDYYGVSVQAGSSLTIVLQPPEGCDFDLKVYWDQDGERMHRVSDNTGDAEDRIEIAPEEFPGDPLHILVCPAMGQYNQAEPYVLDVRGGG